MPPQRWDECRACDNDWASTIAPHVHKSKNEVPDWAATWLQALVNAKLVIVAEAEAITISYGLHDLVTLDVATLEVDPA